MIHGSSIDLPGQGCVKALRPRALPSSPSPCPGCPVRRSGFCSQLSDGTLQGLALQKNRVSLSAGRSLSASGVLGPFNILLRGYLRSDHLCEDGHRKITGLTFPGEPIGRNPQSEYLGLEAATNVEICTLHPASFRDALEHSHEFRRALLDDGQRRIERLRLHAWTLVALSPARRLGAFLIACHRLMPWQPLPSGGGILTMELSRADLADYLATTVETICRVIGRFFKDGLLISHDPRHFEIPDVDRLARHAGIGRHLLTDARQRAASGPGIDSHQRESTPHLVN